MKNSLSREWTIRQYELRDRNIIATLYEQNGVYPTYLECDQAIRLKEFAALDEILVMEEPNKIIGTISFHYADNKAFVCRFAAVNDTFKELTKLALINQAEYELSLRGYEQEKIIYLL